jgi:hypothetical protein
MLTSRFGAHLRNSKWNQHVRFFQPRRALPPEEPEKVALYGSTFLYTHAARQLLNGKWTSKLGRSVDIEHDTPDDLAGGVYGEVQQYMRRAIRRT